MSHVQVGATHQDKILGEVNQLTCLFKNEGLIGFSKKKSTELRDQGVELRECGIKAKWPNQNNRGLAIKGLHVNADNFQVRVQVFGYLRLSMKARGFSVGLL